MNLKSTVEHFKIPFALSPSATLRRALSKGVRDFEMLNNIGKSMEISVLE